MIDMESLVYTTVRAAVVAEYGDSVCMAGIQTSAPAKFPFVTVIQQDNPVYVRSQDSGSLENHVQPMFEVNVYSNKKNGKKEECKAIIGTVDDALMGMGFTRTMMSPILNLLDDTVYRITARYTGVVSRDQIVLSR